ncbi:hypothetical protein GCM10010201_34620 [Pilimelia columellifera subsp. columellifera]|uniref:Uncharacterized protein n=1 Tax=Pilimelia columellifera subsp. columellifera TaxID=706583 RepID=A0ABP6B1T4_9ACTN
MTAEPITRWSARRSGRLLAGVFDPYQDRHTANRACNSNGPAWWGVDVYRGVWKPLPRTPFAGDAMLAPEIDVLVDPDDLAQLLDDDHDFVVDDLDEEYERL